MNAVIQYEFWKPIPTAEELMRIDLDAGLKTLDKMRKSLYARDGAREKRMLELEYRLEILESNLCRGKNVL
jgi:hypothetical protein